jgi:hypothetical protein
MRVTNMARAKIHLECRISLDHRIQLQDNSNLSATSKYMDQMIREATEIELHPNMNGMACLCQSWSWKPLSRSKDVE